MELMKDRLARGLNKLRVKKHLSQGELAEKVGVHLTSVQRWEAALNMPRDEQVAALCKVLKCKLSQLIPKAIEPT